MNSRVFTAQPLSQSSRQGADAEKLLQQALEQLDQEGAELAAIHVATAMHALQEFRLRATKLAN